MFVISDFRFNFAVSKGTKSCSAGHQDSIRF